MSQYKKHYLITGGAGFIGSNLIKALLKDESIPLRYQQSKTIAELSAID